MKLKHLLALALVAMGSSAWAQDFTSGSTYYFQNVETGRFISSGATWGTKATLSPVMDIATVLEADGSNWKIKTQGTQYLGKDAYADQGAQVWTIEAVAGEANTYTVMANGKYLGNSNNLVMPDLSSVTAASKWIIKSVAEYEADMDNAAADAPVNCSFYIKAPNASYIDNPSYTTNWSGVSGSVERRTNLSTGQRQNWAALSPYTVQIYNGTGTTSQSVKVSKAGVYAVGVYGFYRASARDKSEAYLYAGDDKVMLKYVEDDAQATAQYGCLQARNGKYVPNSNSDAGEAFAHGLYKNVLLIRVDDPSTAITIGIKKESTESGDWTCWDNFFMEYYGDVTVNEVQLATYIKEYNTAKTTAEAFTEASMYPADWTVLQTAITNNTLDLGTATQEQLVTATSNLNDAIAAANTAVANYAELIANTAAVAGADLNNPVATNFVKNGTFDSNRDNWLSTTGAQNQALASNQQGAFTGKFFENWNPNNYQGKIYQTIKNVPNGIYELSICAFASVHDAEHQFVYANDAKVYLTTGAPTAYKVLVQVENNEIEVGLNQDAAVNNWLGIDNISLSYYGNYTLADVLINTVPTDPMNATVKANLDAAVAALEADKSSQAAYDALVVEINKANASVDIYKKINAALTAENTLDAAGKAALDYSTVQSAYDNRTITDGNAETAAMKAAMVVAAKAQTTPGSDMTVAVSGNDGSTLEGWNRAFDGDGTVGTFEVNTWSTEADASNMKTPFVQSWVAKGSNLSDATITNNSITGLKHGLYKVTLFSRIYSESGDAPTGATFFVGENEVDMTSTGTAFDFNNMKGVYGTYEATAQLDNDDASIAFGVKIKDATFNWVAIKNVTLTYLGNPVTEADKQALSDAIAAVEDNVVGFLDGEYAPYNNAAAINALAAAKAIDVDNDSREAVVEATNNLTNATWTANDGEVNAVYDGTFASATNNGAPAGWTMSNNTLGGDYHSRAFVGDERLSEFNSTNSGLFLRFDGTNSNRGSMYYYGNAEGYTMPLKANTTYKVSVDFAGWGSTGKPLRLNVTGPEGFTATGVQANTSVKADTEAKDPQNHTIVFTTGPAGNYVINFQTPGADSNTHNVVVSNIVLKLAAIERTTAIEKYGTICAPFAAKAEGAKVYSAAVNGTEVELTEVSEMVAGVPYIYQATEDAQTFSYASGSLVEAPVAAAPLVGVFEATPVPVGSYVMQTQNGAQKFYIVAEGKQPTLSANKAYLTVPTTTEAKVLSIGFAEETAIKAIDALMSGDAKIYDLNGREQKSLQKGVNIVNGVKVLVK